MINDALIDLLGAAIEALRRRRRLRFAITVFAGSLALTALVVWIAAPFVVHPDLAQAVGDVAAPVSALSGFVLVIALASFTGLHLSGGGVVRLELDSLREEREEIRRRLAEKKAPDVLDTIALNLNQLSEYYAINKSQARSSFRFSVFSVVVGLTTLIGGIWLFYLGDDQNLEMAVITGVSGTLIQFIGAAYFYLYRKSLDQLNFFFEQLVGMQDTMLSVRLCDEIQSSDRQEEVREHIIVTLLARSSRSGSIPGTGKYREGRSVDRDPQEHAAEDGGRELRSVSVK